MTRVDLRMEEVLDDRQHFLKRWIQPVLGQVLEP